MIHEVYIRMASTKGFGMGRDTWTERAFFSSYAILLGVPTWSVSEIA